MNAFKKVALGIADNLNSRLAVSDADSEWQRVNTYIADVLKDAHVLYAKLARLQGDFGGEELKNLERISESVLGIGGKLSSFSKAFYEGKVKMSDTETFGETPSEPSFEPPAPAPADTSMTEESEPSHAEEKSEDDVSDLDVEFDYDAKEDKSDEDDEEDEKDEKKKY